MNVHPPRSPAQRGASMVEFGIVVPIYFLVVFGCVYSSIVFLAWGNMVFASRLALRYAVVHGSGSTLPCSATDLQNLITPNLWAVPNPAINVQWNPNNDSNSGRVTITISSNLPGIPLTTINKMPLTVSVAGNILQ